MLPVTKFRRYTSPNDSGHGLEKLATGPKAAATTIKTYVPQGKLTLSQPFKAVPQGKLMLFPQFLADSAVLAGRGRPPLVGS